MGTTTDTESRRSRPRWLALSIGAFALAAAVAVALAVVSDGESSELNLATDPSRHGEQTAADAKELYLYDDLAQMQATSDLVIAGHVTSVEPGRIVGPEGSRPVESGPVDDLAGEIQLYDVEIAVEEWLGGQSEVSDGTTVSAEEDAMFVSLSEKGDAGVYFLAETDDPGTYVLAGSAARFLAFGDGTVESSNPEFDWAQKAESESADELIEAVEENQDAVEAGQVEPAEPM